MYKLMIRSILLLLLLSACGGQDIELVDEHMGHETGGMNTHNPDALPNEGAVIHIVSPESGARFKAGAEIEIQVETENFMLGEDGKHWHIFIDDVSWGMVMGHNYQEIVRGLVPGEYEISVIMSVNSHEELQDGDVIKIIIEE